MRGMPAAMAALVILAMPACVAATLRGSGHPASEQRAVGDFHALAVSIPARIELIQGGEEGLRITADDNVLAHVETTVGAGVLRIRFPRQLAVHARTPIAIELHVRTIDHIALAGAARLIAPKLDVDRLGVELTGTPMFTLPDLRAHELSIHASGHCHGMAAGRVD